VLSGKAAEVERHRKQGVLGITRQGREVGRGEKRSQIEMRGKKISEKSHHGGEKKKTENG